MRRAFLIAIVFPLISPCILQAQENKKMDIEISTAVLSTAEWANFKYMETLDLAQNKDTKSIKALLEFSSIVDGTEAILHALTCIELIPFAGDDLMATSITQQKPKLKPVLLKRFQLAQARSQKAELRKPFQEWAPLTWKALNGEIISCNTCMHEIGKPMEKPGSTKPGVSAPAPAFIDNSTEKQ